MVLLIERKNLYKELQIAWEEEVWAVMEKQLDVRNCKPYDRKKLFAKMQDGSYINDIMYCRWNLNKDAFGVMPFDREKLKAFVQAVFNS